MIRRMDMIVIAASLFLAIFVMLLMGTKAGISLVVEINGEKKATLSLERDGEYLFDTDSGQLIVVIANNSARISHSDCQNQSCVRSGSISKVGQSVICLPLRCCIYLTGEKSAEVLDGITG